MLIVLFFFPWDFGKHADWKRIKNKNKSPPPPPIYLGGVTEAVRLAASAQRTRLIFFPVPGRPRSGNSNATPATILFQSGP